MNFDMDYVLDFLLKILKTPSPTGNTERAIALVEEEFNKLGLKIRRNNKGALIGTLEGENKEKEITMSAHIDTLGGMVKDIKSNGRLKLTSIGGYVFSTIEGEYVSIETTEGDVYTGTVLINKASSHVHGSETKSQDRDAENMEIRLDERVFTKEDVENLGISVGDFIFFDPRAILNKEGFIKSRHLDDKAGVASMVAIAKYLVENNIKPKYTTNFFISNYEEVGHGSSASIPEKTFEFIAIDMAAPGEGQTSDEFSVTICAKDSTGPYDIDLRRKLEKIAKENDIDYKIDIYPYYSSDASAALRAGYDFKAGLIGPGVDASHSYERTHKDAIENTVKLGVYYLLSE